MANFYNDNRDLKFAISNIFNDLNRFMRFTSYLVYNT